MPLHAELLRVWDFLSHERQLRVAVDPDSAVRNGLACGSDSSKPATYSYSNPLLLYIGSYTSNLGDRVLQSNDGRCHEHLSISSELHGFKVSRNEGA